MDEILAYLRNTFPGLEFERGQALYARNPIQFQWARFTGNTLYYCSDKAAWNEVPRSMYQGMVDRPLVRRKEFMVPQFISEADAQSKGIALAQAFKGLFETKKGASVVAAMSLGWDMASLKGIEDKDAARAFAMGFASVFDAPTNLALLEQELKQP